MSDTCHHCRFWIPLGRLYEAKVGFCSSHRNQSKWHWGCIGFEQRDDATVYLRNEREIARGTQS